MAKEKTNAPVDSTAQFRIDRIKKLKTSTQTNRQPSVATIAMIAL